MRADRLLAILLLLQSHRELTASQLAEQLEVSVRTIYRDMQALSAAGVPVYTQHGPGGGCRLIEEYRTNLPSLTPAEIDALQLLNLPESLAPLEAGQKLKTAFLKLFAALPAGQSKKSDPRIYLDWTGWGLKASPGPFLNEIYQAAMNNTRMIIKYHLADHLPIEQVIEPYGLVAKAGDWQLVFRASRKFQIKRVHDLDEVRILKERFLRQEAFDLEKTWNDYCQRLESAKVLYWVVLCVDPRETVTVKQWLSSWSQEVRTVEIEGNIPKRTVLEVAFNNFVEARTQLLGLGGAAEVIEPLPLRWSLTDFANQTLQVYNNSTTSNQDH